MQEISQKFCKQWGGVLLNYRHVLLEVRERIPTLTALWLSPVHVTNEPENKKCHITQRKGFTTTIHQPAAALPHGARQDQHLYIPY